MVVRVKTCKIPINGYFCKKKSTDKSQCFFKCRWSGSNRYGIATTGFWVQRVCQFHHTGVCIWHEQYYSIHKNKMQEFFANKNKSMKFLDCRRQKTTPAAPIYSAVCAAGFAILARIKNNLFQLCKNSWQTSNSVILYLCLFLKGVLFVLRIWGDNYANKDYIGVHGVQAEKLRHH